MNIPVAQINMLDDEYVEFAVEILVENLTKSIDFYKIIRFEVIRTYNSDDYDFATLKFANTIIMLKEDRRVNKVIDGSIIQLRFILNDDLTKFHEHVQQQNIPILKPLGDIYYGLRRFSISDPDGYELKFGMKQ